MQAVILAGGLGTRLKPFTEDYPKPMFEIGGKPFIVYLIEQVYSWGIKDIILLLGYRADVIQNYLGDGSSFGVHISYSVTPKEYDTGARIRSVQNILKEEFLLLYCDNYCPINYQKAYELFRDSKCMIQVTAYANRDGYTKNNLKTEGTSVVKYDKKRETEGLNAVDIGYALIKKEALRYLPEGNINFEREVYPVVVGKNQMSVYLTEHRYYSIGSWERMELTKQFFQEKDVVFLDRDGTLNKKPPKACYIENPEEFVWMDGAKEAVKRLKDAGYTIYLFTNQPGIARGRLSQEDLEAIHKKMQQELEEVGAGIDGIYCCSHNWDEGCFCRKPKPGLLYQAQREHSLNLPKCIVIGDDDRDMDAGNAAGCDCIQVSEEYPLLEAVKDLLKR